MTTEKRIQEAAKELKTRLRKNGNIWCRIELKTTGQQITIVRAGDTAYEKPEEDNYTIKFEGGTVNRRSLKRVAAYILDLA